MPRREPLCLLPTPCHRLNRLSDQLGVDLWIKRDDLTGFAGGGNKGRKLEYLIAEALDSGAQVVVSNGSLQSNFIRQLGAACSRFGLRCAAAVMKEPYDETFGRPEGPSLAAENGNVLLDRLFGVELHQFEDAPWETLWEHAEAVAQSYEAQGLKVFRVPVGGSSPLGAYSFYEASREVEGFDVVVACSSSGSTQTGLAYGFQGTSTRVIGIAVDPEEDLFEDMARLSRGLHEIVSNSPSLSSMGRGLGGGETLPPLSPSAGRGAGGEGQKAGPMKATDFDLRFDWVGLGYGIATPEGMDAIRLMARTEGILLDPVYSGKAFAALLDLVGRGEVSGRVLFWHTGGVPSLFAASHLL